MKVPAYITAPICVIGLICLAILFWREFAWLFQTVREMRQKEKETAAALQRRDLRSKN